MDNNSGRDPAPGFTPNGDEISLVELANMVLRHWKVVAVLPTVIALGVAVWTLSQDRQYRASASFFPQAAETRGAGGAAALAQQFGVSLGPERPAHSPQFYADLLRSRAILREAVESEYQLSPAEGAPRQATLVELFVGREPAGHGPPWLEAVDTLRQKIAVSVARETGVVNFAVLSTDPTLAEQIAERLLDLLNRFNLEVRQGHAREESRFIGGRLEEAQVELAAAETALQNFLRQNREFRNSPALAFEHDRLYRDVSMRQELYTSLLRSQEQARLDGVRDTPLITVVDHPAGSAEPQRRGTVMRALLGFVLGLIISVAIVIAAENARRGREAEDPRYHEFRNLARQAWTDLRRPTAWFRRGSTPRVGGRG